jgi:CRP-like cAMP-binding protein
MRIVDAVTRFLEENPIFRDLTPEQTHIIADCASLLVYQAGDYIYRELQPANRFLIVRHGRVAVEVHVPGRAPIIVDMLGDGDVLGWSWLLAPYVTHFDCRAVELTRAISFDAKCLRGKMEHDPALGYQIHKRMAPVIAARLASARRQLIDLYGRPDPRSDPWR